ncbi:hypothetical protein TWF696_000352 [Orbilia brochopaga]|uniref:Uncharacterized protein n=1 Tax=Orbilia brochopaga TaxID=3140254 RepID=A0AAV9VB13_9PEZI
MEFEWTCCRCRQENSTCTRCNCNHSYCNVCANIVPRCTSQPPIPSAGLYSPLSPCDYTSSSSSSPVLSYASFNFNDESIRPRSTPQPLGVLHSTHPANQLSLIAPFYDSAPPSSVPPSTTGTVTTISSNGGSSSRRRHLIRPRLSISHFKGLWSSSSSSCDDHSDDENFGGSSSTTSKHTPSSSMSRVDKWWLQL